MEKRSPHIGTTWKKDEAEAGSRVIMPSRFVLFEAGKLKKINVVQVLNARHCIGLSCGVACAGKH